MNFFATNTNNNKNNKTMFSLLAMENEKHGQSTMKHRPILSLIIELFNWLWNFMMQCNLCMTICNKNWQNITFKTEVNYLLK